MTPSQSIASSKTLTDIANAIRKRNGKDVDYRPGEMAAAITALDGSGSDGPQKPYSLKKRGLMTDSTFTDIANAIRGKNGTRDRYKPNEMAAAILALELETKSMAYGIAIPDSTGSKYELHFMRATKAPVVGDMYKAKQIKFVYSDFEDREYPSNSTVPWYSRHDDFTSVHFDDDIRPRSLSNWFYMFRNCATFDLAKLDTSDSLGFKNSFFYCNKVQELDLRHFKTGNAADFSYIFYYCTALKSLNVSGWDVSKATTFREGFRNCTGLTSLIGLDTWHISTLCTTMESMFRLVSGCTMLKFGDCDLSAVDNFNSTFYQMAGIEIIDLSTCRFGKPSNIGSMFYGCKTLQTIYTTRDCDLSEATMKTMVFYDCAALKADKGSKLDSGTCRNMQLTTGDYARVDGVDGRAGYFTEKQS